MSKDTTQAAFFFSWPGLNLKPCDYKSAPPDHQTTACACVRACVCVRDRCKGPLGCTNTIFWWLWFRWDVRCPRHQPLCNSAPPGDTGPVSGGFVSTAQRSCVAHRKNLALAARRRDRVSGSCGLCLCLLCVCLCVCVSVGLCLCMQPSACVLSQ